jgi:glycerol-3-phosphate dehydrogenase (NAD(P)+)
LETGAQRTVVCAPGKRRKLLQLAGRAEVSNLALDISGVQFMADYKNVAIIGAGAWGTALGCALARSDHNVTVWARSEHTVNEYNATGTNKKYLKDTILPSNMKFTCELSEATDSAELMLFVVPAQSTRDIATRIALHIQHTMPVIACAKGIEQGTLKLQSDILSQTLPGCLIGALSGPSFAMDVARGLPTAVALGMDDLEAATDISSALSSQHLRVYSSNDLIGIQLGGSLKNVLALAVGIARGSGMGASAEAALITRGYAEISRIATQLNAKSETLNGLSGLGDLVLTCSSTLSRNFSYGIAIGRNDDISGLKLVEGLHTLPVILEIAKQNNIECPIMESTAKVLLGQLSKEEAFLALMNRPVKPEFA